MKKLLVALLLVFSIFGLVGCTTTKEYDLKVTFFNGGYGEDWIRNSAARFEAATGKRVEVVSSNEGNTGAENYIKSGYNLSDIYIGECMPWKTLVQEGKLADLTDVYEAEVEKMDGTKIKVKDFISSTASKYFYSQRSLDSQNYVPWALPWTVQPNAMAYNEDILLAMRHVSTIEVSEGCVGADGLWKSVPRTYQDLLAFCEDVYAFDNNSAEKQALGDTHSYAPIGWAGSGNVDSIGFLIITWWAEAQGLVTSNYEGEGSFYDFFNYGNTTESNVGQTLDMGVFDQTGLALAYDKFVELLIDRVTQNGEAGYNDGYKNTIAHPYVNNLQQLQQLFVANRVSEKPVLSIASSYLENEVIKNQYIDSDKDGKQDVNFKFMNVPSLYSTTEKQPLYCRLSDCMMVPAKAPHLETAKEFLIFMCNESEIVEFSKDTNGGIRPFNCDVRKEGVEYSAFAKSLFDVYYNSEQFTEFPSNAQTLAGVAHVWRYNEPTYHGNVSWTDILNIMRDPTNVNAGQAIATEVKFRLEQAELANWIRKFHLTDITER